MAYTWDDYFTRQNYRWGGENGDKLFRGVDGEQKRIWHPDEELGEGSEMRKWFDTLNSVDAQGRPIYGTEWVSGHGKDGWSFIGADGKGRTRHGNEWTPMDFALLQQAGISPDVRTYDERYGYSIPSDVATYLGSKYNPNNVLEAASPFLMMLAPLAAAGMAGSLGAAAGTTGSAAGSVGSVFPSAAFEIGSSLLGGAGAGATAGAGTIGALSAADIVGLTQMGQAAGLTGDALAQFVAQGGAANIGIPAATGGLTLADMGIDPSNYFTNPSFQNANMDWTDLLQDWIDPNSVPFDGWTTNPSLSSLEGGLTDAQSWAESLGGLKPDGSIDWAKIDQALNNQGITGIDGSSMIPAGASAQGTGSSILDTLNRIRQIPGVGSLLNQALGGGSSGNNSLLGTGLGGLLGYLSGRNPNQVTQNTDVPEWLKPYYTGGLNAGLAQLGASKNLTANEQQTIDQMLGRLGQPNAGLDAANKAMTDTASGNYLSMATNPQWQDLSTQIGEKYNMITRPATDQQFSRAGAFGVGNTAWQEYSGQNQADLSRGLATGAANIYGQERERQMNAAGAMPGFQNQYLTGLGNSALQLGNYQRMQPWQGILNYGQLLGNLRGPSTTSQSTSASPWQSALGGAMSGYALSNLWK